MWLELGTHCLGGLGLRLVSTGTWPVLTAACLAEQVYMTIVTYSISSGIVRKQVGKPEGWWNRPCHVNPEAGWCPAEGASTPSSPYLVNRVDGDLGFLPSTCTALLWPQTFFPIQPSTTLSSPVLS